MSGKALAANPGSKPKATRPTLPTDFQAGTVHDGPDGGAGYEFGESAFCWFFSPHWDKQKKMFRLWYMEGKQDYQRRHDKGVWEFYMAPSRDAVHYNFDVAAYPRKTLIPRGPDGSFDKDCVRPPANIITHNGQHWIYYLGTNERWGARKWDARIGLAKLRLDGFFCLQAKDDWGQVTTKPFRLEGDTLEVNIDASDGQFLVEVLAENHRPYVEGEAQYDWDNNRIYEAVDELRLRPRWRGDQNLEALQGRVVRLRFHLRNAKLYAFQVKQSGQRASVE